MSKALVAMGLVVLLAGCTGTPTHTSDTTNSKPPPSTATTSTSSTTSGTTSSIGKPAVVHHQLELDCVNASFTWATEHQLPAEWFPPGFHTDYLASDATPNGVLDLFDCASVVVDNRTVLQHVQFSMLSVAVTADSSVPQYNSATSNVLVLELLISNATLANVLTSFGFPAAVSAFQVQYTSDMHPSSWTVSLAGQAVYSYTGAGEPSAASGTTASRSEGRLHDWNGTKGSESWMDIAFDYQDSQALPDAAAVQAPGGRIGVFSAPEHAVEGATTTTPHTHMTLKVRPT